MEGRRIDYSSIFIGTRRSPHRQNQIATKANCKLVCVTIANSTVSREPATFERHTTHFICSCRSSDAMPPSHMFDTTSQVFQRNHLCSHNVGGQLMSINVFRPLAEPSTNDPRDTSKKKNTLHTSKTNITRLWASLQRATFELRFVWFPCKTIHVGPSLFSVL